MKPPLNQRAATAAFTALFSLVLASPSIAAAAPVRVCTFPGSPSAALDKSVAQQAFKTAGISATLVEHGIGGAADDDGVSLKELRRTLGRGCDVIAGFPRSSVADAADGAMSFSSGYLRTDYVSVGVESRTPSGAGGAVLAATYGSPSQLIAVQEHNVRFDLENSPEQTVEAVVSGRAQRAIVWYPAVVAYEQAHSQRHLNFNVRATRSPYSGWQLVFAFAPHAAALRRKVDSALDTMRADGRLTALTRAWSWPTVNSAAQAVPAAFAYRDTPTRAIRRALPRDATYSMRDAGRIEKVSDATAGSQPAPAFDRAQVAQGKRLYGSSCAKCHGANLQGITAPALSGPAFAPVSGSHLTIGGIYSYLSTNMPADRPGKLKDDEYVDIMAYLLSANGYAATHDKMTADSARSSTMLLNAGPFGGAHAGATTASAK